MSKHGTVAEKVYESIERNKLCVPPLRLALLVRDAQYAKKVSGTYGLKRFLAEMVERLSK